MSSQVHEISSFAVLAFTNFSSYRRSMISRKRRLRQCRVFKGSHLQVILRLQSHFSRQLVSVLSCILVIYHSDTFPKVRTQQLKTEAAKIQFFFVKYDSVVYFSSTIIYEEQLREFFIATATFSFTTAAETWRSYIQVIPRDRRFRFHRLSPQASGSFIGDSLLFIMVNQVCV